ncbi:MAG: hypothetical protein LQ340_007039, partial [Diploschistes diacapsis]
MADSISDSDADKIRNKRLAKLANQPQSPTSSWENDKSASSISEQPAASGPIDQPASRPKINITSTLPPQQTPQNPFSQLGISPASGDGASDYEPVAPPTQSLLKRSRPSESNGVAATESLETWEDRSLSAIFRLSLDPDKKHDHLGHILYYAEGVRQELEEQQAPLQLNVTVLEQAILEAGSSTGKLSPFDYMLGCWKRISKQLRTLKAKPDEAKLNIIREARRICMSYCVFAVTMADSMFGRESPSLSPLLPHLLIESEDDRGLCHEFLQEISSRFAEDETAQEAIVWAIEDLSRGLAKMTMNDNFKPYILAMNVLIQSSLFLPSDIPASTLEVQTLLGPFFQISPLQASVTTNYFSSPKTRDKGSITNAQNALRMTLRTHQSDLLDITNHIIKTGKESRERMLDWFARCINQNHKRRALRVDHKTVSSDGFMINITVTLDQLCEPFMDASFSKIDRIDVDYLRRNPRVDIKEETKLNADQQRSDRFYSQKAEGQSNFISEVFFLTLAAHHYGTEAANSTLSQLEKELKHMEKQIAAIETDRAKFERNPAQLAVFERALQKYKDQIDKGLSYKMAVQGVLLDELTQARSMQFMRYAMVWLLRLVSPGQSYPRQPIKLPLPEEEPEIFSCLPEYFIEDVVDNFKFITRNMPQIVTTTQSDELVVLCITFLRSSEYIKNPYLKAGLVTIMFYGTWPIYGRTKGILGDILFALPFATEHLLHALMKFYIEVENTGAHTQFYDKFNIRYEIFQIIKCVWSNTVYRERLSSEAKINLDFFVRFVNLLLNDVTFVLDETLSSLLKIHDLSELLKTELEPNIKTEKEEALSEAQNRAKSYMQLANETVSMLKLFTEALADSFTMPEIVQRLADMLDYNLDALIGPKSVNLKVERPEDYGFNPKVLLSEITDVYLNLSEKENFITAVARDGRSYKPENFVNAAKVMEKHVLKPSEQLQAWKALYAKFAKAKEIDMQAEEDLGDIPDEFL